MLPAKRSGRRRPRFPRRTAHALIALSAAALALSGCGSTSKPLAGSAASVHPGAPGVHARIDDPRPKHLACLKQHNLPVSEPGRGEIQVGPAGVGPLIKFTPTPGNAQSDQIEAKDPGAEVIGSALLFPNRGSDSELETVESCTALGVSG